MDRVDSIVMSRHQDEFEAYRARSYSGGGFSSFRRRAPGLNDCQHGSDGEAGAKEGLFRDEFGGVEAFSLWDKKRAGFVRRRDQNSKVGEH